MNFYKINYLTNTAFGSKDESKDMVHIVDNQSVRVNS